MEGRRIAIRGAVQGVGFRPWVFRLAREESLAGRVRNDAAGVTIEAFGTRAALDAFIGRLRAEAPAAAAIRALECEALAPQPVRGFTIEPSRADSVARQVSIPPDLATCAACLAEVLDPRDRRHGYAFTNCTDCGPRFTIALDAPYDRARTTMAGFRMCPQCEREYGSPSDRRFHAQPNACPTCGPRLSLLSCAGADDAADPLAAVARRLVEGGIAAVKSLGGFHLAVDATSPAAVARLRLRKRREQKPFAVMARDLAQAETLARLDDAERALLVSAARPIVLARRREGAALAPEVAPDGNPLVGLLLPATPLHHLLLRAVGRPLVMTSGNLADEPLAYDNHDARARLGGIADVLLGHDRAIAAPCDDSVCRVIAGAPVVLRRARGYVPRPVALARPLARPILGCGAHLKNAVCLGVGDSAHLGPHVGDLDNADTTRAFEESIARLERFLRARPEVVAHDLHPDYVSTAHALARPEPVKVGVQHHHAHVVGVMAEHGLPGPVIGVAYDGTGYGTDGTAWGGEALLATPAAFERVGTFRVIPLAGGEAAIRQCWRVALALLDDAYDGAPPLERLPLFASLPARELDGVRHMLARRVNTPLARGIGRYFDGFGALFLNRPRAAYEGQVALLWNLAAAVDEGRAYVFDLDGAAPLPTVDLRPSVRAAVADFDAGRPAGTISARFHNTLAAATAALVRGAARRHGRLPVVLGGGCFQNPLLAEGVLRALGRDFDVRLPREAPPGDGGIALGQVVIADALTRGAA